MKFADRRSFEFPLRDEKNYAFCFNVCGHAFVFLGFSWRLVFFFGEIFCCDQSSRQNRHALEFGVFECEFFRFDASFAHE
jgi:hypothetical protein